ncbi:MAG: RagB/SusD family nutrient uptake outer membrane protein [Bacteroidetes bacterium]|nr:RagB/SusD family nutrient uptake outer membrane protein [Bacteroidota bacterium]
MKKSVFKFIIPFALIFLTLSYSCKKFLNQPIVNQLSPSVLATKAGVDGLLIGAYAMLPMSGNPTTGDTWGGSVSNWHFGGIGSDDANKGSNPTDQPDAAAIMNHSVDGSNDYVRTKWWTCLTGVQRANDVLREIPQVKDGSLSADYAAEVTAEAKFLRGVFNLELSKIYRNVPYVDETVTYSAGNYNVSNPGPIWDKVEADLTAAVGALPATQAQLGRANKYAAEAFLAKALMFDHQYDQALTALTDIMTNGVTDQGVHFGLNDNFNNNFDAAMKNGPEAVFAVQMAVQDGSSGANGNPGDILNFPAAGPSGCCGFYQPSFTLVNAFRVNAQGLPFINADGSLPLNDYDGAAINVADAAHGGNPGNTSTLKSDQGVDATDATYMPDQTTPVDPRLDWTAGRRGIPFLDYGIEPGASWARAQGDAGPYINMKNIYRQSEAATQSESYGGWAPGQASAMNYNMIRYSDILLMAAECQVEKGNQVAAEDLVNQVRNRMANHPENWVKGRLTGYTGNDATKPIVDNTQNAANYQIKPYTGQIATGTKEFARQAVFYERRLELAMEGQRFFDLQRWDGTFGGPEPTGWMAATLNKSIHTNTSYPSAYFGNGVMKNATFTAGRNEIYPIPTIDINNSHGALKQNAGYP